MPRKNRWDQMIDHWDPILRKAFSDSVQNLRSAAHLDQIVRMLEAGDVEGAIRAVGLDPVAFRPFDKAISNAFEAGGNATARIVPQIRAADGLRTTFQFNVRNPAAERWLTERSSTQITQILDDQRFMIREYLRAGMSKGLNPRTVALDLVGRVGASGQRENGVLGLTSSQEGWLRNYSDALASENPADALTYKLRDARFDGAVRKAVKAGEPIPAGLRGKMETAYTNRALRYRAETIARTEAMASLHAAQDEAMSQAVASGSTSQDTVTEIWHTAGDNRVRDSHAEMEGQTIKMGDMFTTGNGVQLAYPGDPNGPPEEIISCRCWREFSIDFLAGLE